MDFRRNQGSIDLCGQWSFAYSEGPTDRRFRSREEIESAGFAIYPCSVPGNFELDLHANGIIDEPFFGMNIAGLTKYERSHVWYFRSFEAAERPGFDAELVFEGLDCFADIYLNGELVASTDNMLIEHVVCVNGCLRGENELLVHIRPAVEEARKFDYPPSVGALGDFQEALYVRKAPHMYGWDIMPRAVSAGIWRPIRLRYRPVERLEHVFLENVAIAPDHSWARLRLHYTATIVGSSQDSYEVTIEGVCGESRFSARKKAGAIGGKITLGVREPKLWWVRGRGEPNLYDVVVTLLKNGSQIDQLTFTHGIKHVDLVRTSTTDMLGTGEFCFRLNGEKVFVLGTNWVPADAYHSRDAQRLPRILEMVEDIGCNLVRCWGGNVYENDLFYEFCDRHGIMVWQDFAMACAYPPQDEGHQKRIAREVRAVVRRLRQHACLALWSGDNEIDIALASVGRDPNRNVLTRKVIPQVLQE
ncbi:MAG: glycoside hydrolase family 2 protein, partial [Armatimonadota bacterium]